MSLGVKISDVTKKFGAKAALEGIGIEFVPGKVHAVIGPNGSGKTTLLRVAAGLEGPDSGNVVYRDEKGTAQKELRLMRRVTLVSQKPVMFQATVYRNVAYGLSVRGMGKGEIDGRVRDAARLFGIEGLLKAHAHGLSGGEAQRVALARAWAIRPELALLDEPSASLDPEGGRLMEDALLRMAREWGSAVVFSTHNLFQARRIADHVFFLYEGRLVEGGEKDAFFGGPREGLTRRFLSGEIVF